MYPQAGIFDWGSSAAPAAGDFLAAQKVTKKAPGGGSNRIRLRLILHVPTPWTPHFTGAANAEVLAVNAKARVVQLTGFRSISAAAEGPVTLGVSSMGGERAFVWVGLKCGSEERRAGEGTRPYTDTGTDPFFS